MNSPTPNTHTFFKLTFFDPFLQTTFFLFNLPFFKKKDLHVLRLSN